MRITYLILLALCLSSVPATSGDGNSHGNSNGNAPNQGNGKQGNGYARGREKHGVATVAISSVISLDSGLPVDHYADYSSNLANTLGQLDEVTLSRVLKENRGKLP